MNIDSKEKLEERTEYFIQDLQLEVDSEPMQDSTEESILGVMEYIKELTEELKKAKGWI